MISKENAKKVVSRRTGFTLIEVIIVILILGIALMPLGVLMVNALSKNTYPSAQITAAALAEGEMDRITNQKFSTVAAVGSTAFSAPFAAYSYSVAVDYVDAGALNTPVVGPTNYKRVAVTVTSAASGNVTLVTLMTNYVK